MQPTQGAGERAPHRERGGGGGLRGLGAGWAWGFAGLGLAGEWGKLTNRAGGKAGKAVPHPVGTPLVKPTTEYALLHEVVIRGNTYRIL